MGKVAGDQLFGHSGLIRKSFSRLFTVVCHKMIILSGFNLKGELASMPSPPWPYASAPGASPRRAVRAGLPGELVMEAWKQLKLMRA